MTRGHTVRSSLASTLGCALAVALAGPQLALAAGSGEPLGDQRTPLIDTHVHDRPSTDGFWPPEAPLQRLHAAGVTAAWIMTPDPQRYRDQF